MKDHLLVNYLGFHKTKMLGTVERGELQIVIYMTVPGTEVDEGASKRQSGSEHLD